MTRPDESFSRLLNVGCGRCYHGDWTNIDLVASGPGVRKYDLRRGLPYDDESFDAVYHSHVLEHLSPEHAAEMLRECRRVLRIGGVIRVVVPDLEQIARVYLESVSAAATGDETSLANHRWMTLELIDQLARQHGGGQMGELMRDPELINREFVRSRIGGEMSAHRNAIVKTMSPRKIWRTISDVRRQLALAAVTILDGASGRAAYREGRFRQLGEIHRWMYDRVSLAALLHEVGFEAPTACTAQESRIDDFDSYQLDRDEKNVIRKPDSQYMEAIKPAVAGQASVDDSANRAA